MIRHLRWKVVATNMLLISLVLLAVFAAVFFISRDNYRKNVQQQLYRGGGLRQRHRPRGGQQLL